MSAEDAQGLQGAAENILMSMEKDYPPQMQAVIASMQIEIVRQLTRIADALEGQNIEGVTLETDSATDPMERMAVVLEEVLKIVNNEGPIR